MSKGTTEHYTSFKDLREAWGLPKVTNKTRDAKKLKKQQESFLSKHICRACGNPLTYTGGNIMTCTNPDCKGIKIEREDKALLHRTEKAYNADDENGRRHSRYDDARP